MHNNYNVTPEILEQLQNKSHKNILLQPIEKSLSPSKVQDQDQPKTDIKKFNKRQQITGVEIKNDRLKEVSKNMWTPTTTSLKSLILPFNKSLIPQSKDILLMGTVNSQRASHLHRDDLMLNKKEVKSQILKMKDSHLEQRFKESKIIQEQANKKNNNKVLITLDMKDPNKNNLTFRQKQVDKIYQKNKELQSPSISKQYSNNISNMYFMQDIISTVEEQLEDDTQNSPKDEISKHIRQSNHNLSQKKVYSDYLKKNMSIQSRDKLASDKRLIKHKMIKDNELIKDLSKKLRSEGILGNPGNDLKLKELQEKVLSRYIELQESVAFQKEQESNEQEKRMLQEQEYQLQQNLDILMRFSSNGINDLSSGNGLSLFKNQSKEDIIKQLYLYDIESLPNIESDANSPSSRLQTKKFADLKTKQNKEQMMQNVGSYLNQKIVDARNARQAALEMLRPEELKSIQGKNSEFSSKFDQIALGVKAKGLATQSANNQLHLKKDNIKKVNSQRISQPKSKLGQDLPKFSDFRIVENSQESEADPQSFQNTVKTRNQSIQNGLNIQGEEMIQTNQSFEQFKQNQIGKVNSIAEENQIKDLLYTTLQAASEQEKKLRIQIVLEGTEIEQNQIHSSQDQDYQHQNIEIRTIFSQQDIIQSKEIISPVKKQNPLSIEENLSNIQKNDNHNLLLINDDQLHNNNATNNSHQLFQDINDSQSIASYSAHHLKNIEPVVESQIILDNQINLNLPLQEQQKQFSKLQLDQMQGYYSQSQSQSNQTRKKQREERDEQNRYFFQSQRSSLGLVKDDQEQIQTEFLQRLQENLEKNNMNIYPHRQSVLGSNSSMSGRTQIDKYQPFIKSIYYNQNSNTQQSVRIPKQEGIESLKGESNLKQIVSQPQRKFQNKQNVTDLLSENFKLNGSSNQRRISTFISNLGNQEQYNSGEFTERQMKRKYEQLLQTSEMDRSHTPEAFANQFIRNKIRKEENKSDSQEFQNTKSEFFTPQVKLQQSLRKSSSIHFLSQNDDRKQQSVRVPQSEKKKFKIAERHMHKYLKDKGFIQNNIKLSKCNSHGKLIKSLAVLSILEKRQIQMNQDYELINYEGEFNIRTLNSYRKRDIQEPLAYVKSYGEQNLGEKKIVKFDNQKIVKTIKSLALSPRGVTSIKSKHDYNSHLLTPQSDMISCFGDYSIKGKNIQEKDISPNIKRGIDKRKLIFQRSFNQTQNSNNQGKIPLDILPFIQLVKLKKPIV